MEYELDAMKAELAVMRVEKICMEAWLIAAESELEEKKKVLSEYKAMAKFADDLVSIFIKGGADKLDEGTMKLRLDRESYEGL
ncbi:hypothetical protein PTKIN_Ptkin06aG0166000 [Pterospermum kingtungense]